MARILVIDDEAAVRNLVATILRKTGHEVFEASDGKRGGAVLSEQPVDLIITDLLMPEKDGIEMIMEARRDFPAIRIIAMSGGGMAAPADYLPMAELLGAERTLAKPFTAAQLRALVESVLA